jgi:cytochrome c peroxidase
MTMRPARTVRRRRTLTLATGAAALVAVAAAFRAPPPGDFAWQLPPGFPRPVVPADNPMSAAKVELGRHIFYDARLAGRPGFSCASCHVQALAFTDGRGRSLGVTGETHPRGAMSLANVGYAVTLNWANPLTRRLEAQALVPLFGEHPVEMGLAGQEAAILQRLREHPVYRRLMADAFPGEAATPSLRHVTQALAAFQRTLVSGNSAWDRAQRGDSSGYTAAARRGEALFFSEELECFHCHGGLNFSANLDYEGKGFPEAEFHQTGLYDEDGRGAYPAPNTGVMDVTGDTADMGRFKPPTLRNIAVTAPYMHDGSIATLEDVIAHYAAGGRRRSARTSAFLPGFDLSPSDVQDLVAFLRALTDSSFLQNPAYADPWPGTER